MAFLFAAFVFHAKTDRFRPAVTPVRRRQRRANILLPHQIIGNLERRIRIVLVHLRAGLFHAHDDGRIAFGDLVGDDARHQFHGAAQADDHQTARHQVGLHGGRHVDALDLVIKSKVVRQFAVVALALAVLLHHLRDLRHDGLLVGGRVALGVQFTRAFRVLALGLERGQAHLVDALRAALALVLFLLALVLVGQLDLLLVDQAGL